ncbi:MAG: DUF2087 domain-containing protein [Defluviitaleaceae bacterium]|nr:DUF2087 domain-containing protein [Defluviitaleaceae bacterium]
MNNELFWNASTDELKKGYAHSTISGNYTCLICGEAFTQGIVYPMDNSLYEAAKAIETHVKTSHPPIFDFFLSLGRIYTGLSSGQEEIAKLFFAGHSDKEIVSLTGANSPSTIRNQRFAIREKYKQAKVLVALVELMEEQSALNKKALKQEEKLIDFHPSATSVDERYAITQAEREEVLKRYFGPDNRLLIKGFPAKEKRKIIIMQKLICDFETGKEYTEKEVNGILSQYYEDYVSVRRAMIQYGFIDRNKDGTLYWVKLV